MVDVQNTLVETAILRWGTEQIRHRYLPRLASSVVGAYCLSEAASGSDAFALTTRSVERGDGYAITGRKLWITNGNEADLFIVFATVDPDAGYRGITAFLVDRGTPGFTVGKKEDKLGIRASSTCELLFEECRIPRANVLGEVGKGYKVAIETMNEGRIGIGRCEHQTWRPESATSGLVGCCRKFFYPAVDFRLRRVFDRRLTGQ